MTKRRKGWQFRLIIQGEYVAVYNDMDKAVKSAKRRAKKYGQLVYVEQMPPHIIINAQGKVVE